MKALFVSNDPAIFDPGSSARARMRTYAALVDELHVLSAAPRGAVEVEEGRLFLHPVHAFKLLRMRALEKRARALIAERGIQVVSAQDPFEHGRAAAKAVLGTPAKLHIQVHTDFLSPWFVAESLKNRARVALAERVLPQARGIRVVSERVKASLAARYGPSIKEPAVIPIAVSAEVPPLVPLPPHPFTFVLLTVSRLEKEKRVDDILAALALLPQYPMAGLIVVGDGRERARLERLARSLGLANRVQFLGARPDAWGLMRSAHAYIQASAYEGYGMALVEAALAKVPIITTDVGIVGDVLKGHEDVLVSAVGKPEELALHVSRLLDGPRARLELPPHAEAAVRAHLAAQGNVPERIIANLADTLG